MPDKRLVGFTPAAEEQLRGIGPKLDLRDELETRCMRLCASCLSKNRSKPKMFDLSTQGFGVGLVEVRCKNVGESPQWCELQCGVVVVNLEYE